MKTRGRRRLLGLACWMALGAAAAGARAQTASLVVDLSPGEGGNAASAPTSLLAAGNHVFFLANPTENGDSFDTEELWVSDGTAAGTRQLPDPCMGASLCSLSSQFVASLGGLAFLNEWSFGGPALWRTDGTQAGTFPLPVPPGGLSPLPAGFATLGGALYVLTFAENGPVPEQLWRTDGTVAGSQAIANLQVPQGVLPDPTLLAAGSKLFFLQPGSGPNSGTSNLWASDGTPQGTGLVVSLQQAQLTSLTAAGDRLFFTATMGPNLATTELWVSDGTAAGTSRATSQQFAQVTWLKAEGRRVYFEADDGTHGMQIWVSDGTAAGTRQLTTVPSTFSLPGTADEFAVAGGKPVLLGTSAPGVGSFWAIAPGSPGSLADLCPGGCGTLNFDSTLIEIGGRVVFETVPDEASSAESLWSSDGTAGGTRRLKGCSYLCAQAAIDGTIYFVVQGSDLVPRLWRTDGTPRGTRQLAATPLDAVSAPPLLASFQGKVFFNASDTARPYHDELFVSDGTAAGTHQLTDATDPLSSSPADLVAAGGEVFFSASSTVDPATFWRSAGTAASTVPAAVAPAPGTPPPLAAFGGIVLLQYANASLQLWRSDGTVAGSLPLTSFSAPLAAAPAAPVPCGTGVCFGVVAAGGGGAIWRSDGTPQGTVPLFSLPATVTGIERLAALGNDFYLELDDAQGTTYWHSDGTAGGTVQLLDFPLTPDPSFDPGFVRLGGLVYFILGRMGNLYQTDGTQTGTAPFSFHNDQLVFASDLVAANGALYLFAEGGAEDVGLWRSDGTAAGTALLHPFQTGSNVFAHTGGLIPFGDGLAFYGDDGVHGSELWMTDGTPDGTRMVSDIQPGDLGSNPSGLAVAAGKLFFAADDGIHGNELWESDGTAASTRMVQDIDPGPAASNPSGMTAAGGLLYFSADDGLTGQELWALPLAGPGGCTASATALCLASGRFKVEAFWRDSQGNSGAGQAQPLTGDTGTFWFFSPDNVELIAKVLDGRALNGNFWVFYGALSNVEYSLTVTDGVTGLARRYFNPLGELASVGDTAAFGPLGTSGTTAPGAAAARPTPAAAARPTPAVPGAPEPEAAGACQAGARQLCLNGDRFAVTAKWTDFNGNSGSGQAVGLSGETGYFWFFAAANVETVLKVIDGRALNGHFWVFYGALSDVAYTLTVTDTATGAVRTYTNPAGQFASVADTAAF